MKYGCKHSLARATALVLSAALTHGVSAGIVLPEKGFSAGTPLREEGLARVDAAARAGTVIAYAGAPGGVVFDALEDSRHSPYADALLRYVEAPLDVGLMLRWVRDAVVQSTSGQQRPVAHVSLSGRSVHLAANPTSRPSERRPAEEADPGDDPLRVALTIGNAAYEHVTPLHTPLDDAAELASALERLGFSVVRLADTDRAALESGLREFREKAANAEVAVVYYAGHGASNTGTRYLIPVDAQVTSPVDADGAAVALDLVMDAVEPASELRLIMLDAMFPALEELYRR